MTRERLPETADTTREEVPIRTLDLARSYQSPGGPIAAVRGLNLEIRHGELFGLLGPNGAGKSTTIGMLTTMVIPTSGTARVCGFDVVRRPVEVKRRIGMVSQNNTLDPDLTASENLEFRGRYFGLPGRPARRRADELLAMFGLSHRRAAMPFDLSGGQVRRLMICRALAHRPEVLFLDEPTAGLDPQTRVNLWDTLRALEADGQTILLTTHYMEEAEALCDRVAIIDHGSLLACDTVDRLKKDAAPAAGVTVTEATQLLPSLETVFLTLTGREYRE